MIQTLLWVIFVLPGIMAVNPDARELRIINEAGFKCNIYWINRWKNDELVLNSEEGVFHGGETQINSYVSHEFEVQEVPSKKTGHCKGPNNDCRKGHFQVNKNEEQCTSLAALIYHFMLVSLPFPCDVFALFEILVSKRLTCDFRKFSNCVQGRAG